MKFTVCSKTLHPSVTHHRRRARSAGGAGPFNTRSTERNRNEILQKNAATVFLVAWAFFFYETSTRCGQPWSALSCLCRRRSHCQHSPAGSSIPFRIRVSQIRGRSSHSPCHRPLVPTWNRSTKRHDVVFKWWATSSMVPSNGSNSSTF